MSLVEVLVAMTLMVVVLTVGFVVTTSLSSVANGSQRIGVLTGPAQTGIQVLRQFFSGASPALTTITPAGGQLYTNQCAGGATKQVFPTSQGPFVSASATDVWLCAVRSGSTVAYTYEIHFSKCTQKGVCTLLIDQQPAIDGSVPFQTVAVIASVVCGPCVSATGISPFVFTTTPTVSNLVPALTNPPQANVNSAMLSSIQSVIISLIVASPATNSGGYPLATFTIISQVMLPNSEGGLL